GGGSGGGGPGCGNGLIEDGEECDDANASPGDGCDDCKVECGGGDELEDPVSHHCYHFVPDAETWDAARAACQAWGGDLVAITSAPELDFVHPLVDGDTYIGASDIKVEGVFTWVTGEPWSFANWEPGEPDNGDGNEDCVKMHSGLKWEDVDCASHNGALCERAPPGKKP
ncbi:MAG: hypothetical protein HY744_25250, partial [Deltaproteobacteria bacterium]|nr:hypothetical protein [Deltaproteobacteria bacterium]